jgi:anti-sigma factor RsiW
MSMRDCPNGEVRDLLPAFVHGRLEAAEAARVREHLAACEDCEVEVAVLRSLHDELTAPVPVDLASVTAGVLARTTGGVRLVDAPTDVAPRGAAARPTRWLRAAALVLAVGGGSLLAVQQVLGPGTGPGQPAPQGPVVAMAGETAGLGFGGGVSDLADVDLQELEAAVAALEQQPIGDVESSGDWDVTTTGGDR